jgi:Ca-activated chloride channel family protein
MKQRLAAFLLLLGLCGLASVSYAGWADWWLTPEQRAAKAYEREDIEELTKVAPTADWRGIGEYESGDFAKSAKTFSEAAAQHRLAGDDSALNDALYNQGVSQVQNGQYQEAIDNFDTVISRDPTYADAIHNRDIAEKLLQMQQQPESQSGDGDQGEQQNGEQQQQTDSGQQQSDSGESSESDGGEQSETQGQQQADQSNNQNGDEEADQQQVGSQKSEQDQRDAEQALAAEAANDSEADAQNEPTSSDSDSAELPMSEADQAAEQLLRRIPDDPAGLLRRKLQQSHVSDFPDVGDAREPW